MQSEELIYMKEIYEDKVIQLFELERKYAYMKREKELVENYCDKLLKFIKEQLPDSSIPTWSRRHNIY